MRVLSRDMLIIASLPATIEFLAQYLVAKMKLNDKYRIESKQVVIEMDSPLYGKTELLIPIIGRPDPDEVAGKTIFTVFGMVPFHIAYLAKEIQVIEFTGNLPHLKVNEQFTVEDLKKAGAHVVRYHVEKL
jgi:hypothetical protein